MTSRRGVEHVHHTMTHVGNRAGDEGGGKDELRLSPPRCAMNESRCPQCSGSLGGLLSAERDEESFLACSSALTHGSSPWPGWRSATHVGLRAGRESKQGTKTGEKGLPAQLAKQRMVSRIDTRWLGVTPGSPCDISALGGRREMVPFTALSLGCPKVATASVSSLAELRTAQQCISVIRWMAMVMCIFHGSFSVCFGAE